MRMTVCSVNFQFLHLMASQTGFVGHPPNRPTKNLFGMALKHFLGRLGFQAADIAGVVPIKLNIPFIASEYDLVRVQNHDKISRISMPRKSWFMFADNDPGNHRCQTTHDLVFGIHDVPTGSIGSLGFKIMGTALLRLIRLLLEHRLLELQDALSEVNGILAL